MTSSLQRFIHLFSTDQKFRHRALTDLQSAMASFDLSEEERDILFDMRQLFTQSSEPAGGPNGPWGWQFTSAEPAGGPNGPWGWQFTSAEPAGGPNGPWGWQFISPEQELTSS